jgi:small-conductance mechanosensitive channel
MKLGQEIQVLDKEYDINGTLIDISFFFLYIKTEEGETITIPNSVVLNKVIKIQQKK